MPTGPNPSEARRRYDRMAPTYDRQLAPLRSLQERVRALAIDGLGLRPGDTVLDVGCGTGASFARLVEAVGPGGRVVGVDQSRGMLAEARARIAGAGWTNVELIEAPVQEATIPGPADAALFFFTHDLLRSPAALDNVVDALRPSATVAAAGAKRPAGWFAPLALVAWPLMRRYVTTSDGLDEPWSLLAVRLGDVAVRTIAAGAVYVVRGAAPGPPPVS